jgi:hypothetical protein
MASNGTDYSAYGLSGPADRQAAGVNNDTPNRNPLADHPAVLGYRNDGVSTDDLTSFIESFASLRASRVSGIGHAQYSHAKGQKFESFSPADNIREMVEELADASNYIDFLTIKLLNFASTMDTEVPDCD